MATLLGSSVRLDCPACGEPVSVPVRQLGAEEMTVTVALDLGSFRAHIDAVHDRSRPSGTTPGAPHARPRPSDPS